jgi:hypothetical protein
MNRFLYVEGNPASLIDPTGHYTQGGQTCDPRFDDCDYRDPGEQVGERKTKEKKEK